MANQLNQSDNRDNFLRDSSILLAATFFSSIFNFLFQVYASRALGPVEYGLLGVIFSLFYITSAPVNTIVYSLTQFFARFKAQNNQAAMGALFFRALRRLNQWGLILFLIFVISSPLLAAFLKFPSRWPLFLFGLFLWSSFFFPVTIAFLSGQQKFLALSTLQIIASIAKLVLAVIFVAWGLGVNGAILALVGSVLLPFLLGFFWLKPFFGGKNISLGTREIYAYSVPVFITSLALTFFINIDLILVKHFFNSIEAGFYAAAGTLTKTIYFATASLATALFPKVVAQKEAQLNPQKLLLKALLYLAAGAGFCLFCFYFFPDFLTQLLFGRQYYLKNILFPMGLAVTLLSAVFILTTYLLALSAKKFSGWLLFFAFLEIILIWFNHWTLLMVVKNIIFTLGPLLAILGFFVYKSSVKTNYAPN